MVAAHLVRSRDPALKLWPCRISAWRPWLASARIPSPKVRLPHSSVYKLPIALTAAAAASKTAAGGKQARSASVRRPEAIVLAVITYLGVLLANTLVLQGMASKGQPAPLRVTVALHVLVLGAFAISQVRGQRRIRSLKVDRSRSDESNAVQPRSSSSSRAGLASIVAAIELVSAACLARLSVASGSVSSGAALGSSAGVALLCSMVASQAFMKRQYGPWAWLGAILMVFACPVAVASRFTLPAIFVSVFGGLGMVAKEALLSSSPIVPAQENEAPAAAADGRNLAPAAPFSSVALMIAAVQLLVFCSPLAASYEKPGISLGLARQQLQGLGIFFFSSLSLRLAQLWAVTVLSAPAVQLANSMLTLFVAAAATTLSINSIAGLVLAGASAGMMLVGSQSVLSTTIRSQSHVMKRIVSSASRRTAAVRTWVQGKISDAYDANVAAQEEKRKRLEAVEVPAASRRAGTRLQRQAQALQDAKLAAVQAVAQEMNTTSSEVSASLDDAAQHSDEKTAASEKEATTTEGTGSSGSGKEVMETQNASAVAGQANQKQDNGIPSLTKRLDRLINSLERRKSAQKSQRSNSAGAGKMGQEPRWQAAAQGGAAQRSWSSQPVAPSQSADMDNSHSSKEILSTLNNVALALNVVMAAAFFAGNINQTPRGVVTTNNNTTVLTQWGSGSGPNPGQSPQGQNQEQISGAAQKQLPQEQFKSSIRQDFYSGNLPQATGEAKAQLRSQAELASESKEGVDAFGAPFFPKECVNCPNKQELLRREEALAERERLAQSAASPGKGAPLGYAEAERLKEIEEQRRIELQAAQAAREHQQAELEKQSRMRVAAAEEQLRRAQEEQAKLQAANAAEEAQKAQQLEQARQKREKEREQSFLGLRRSREIDSEFQTLSSQSTKRAGADSNFRTLSSRGEEDPDGFRTLSSPSSAKKQSPQQKTKGDLNKDDSFRTLSSKDVMEASDGFRILSSKQSPAKQAEPLQPAMTDQKMQENASRSAPSRQPLQTQGIGPKEEESNSAFRTLSSRSSGNDSDDEFRTLSSSSTASPGGAQKSKENPGFNFDDWLSATVRDLASDPVDSVPREAPQVVYTEVPAAAYSDAYRTLSSSQQSAPQATRQFTGGGAPSESSASYRTMSSTDSHKTAGVAARRKASQSKGHQRRSQSHHTRQVNMKMPKQTSSSGEFRTMSSAAPRARSIPAAQPQQRGGDDSSEFRTLSSQSPARRSLAAM